MVKLKRIDETNFMACFRLKLADKQEHFVSHPIRSLAQAYVYYHQCTPFGIYDEDTMVGYVMVIYDSEEKSYNLWHLMIDENHQLKGYGTAAVRCCMDYVQTKPFGESNVLLLTCHKDNRVAMHIYAKLGFVPTGNCDEEEIEFKWTLD